MASWPEEYNARNILSRVFLLCFPKYIFALVCTGAIQICTGAVNRYYQKPSFSIEEYNARHILSTVDFWTLLSKKYLFSLLHCFALVQSKFALVLWIDIIILYFSTQPVPSLKSPFYQCYRKNKKINGIKTKKCYRKKMLSHSPVNCRVRSRILHCMYVWSPCILYGAMHFSFMCMYMYIYT